MCRVHTLQLAHQLVFIEISLHTLLFKGSELFEVGLSREWFSENILQYTLDFSLGDMVSTKRLLTWLFILNFCLQIRCSPMKILGKGVCRNIRQGWAAEGNA